MKNLQNIVKKMVVLLVAICTVIVSTTSTVQAVGNSKSGFLVSPMNQSIVLSPGDIYKGSFTVANPNDSEDNLVYSIKKRSFYVDENYDTTYDEVDSPIVEWTTIDSGESGILEPNESADVMFTINVPNDVAAGGQYEAFQVIAGSTVGDEEVGMIIQENLIITHLVFAEIAGDTIKQGEIVNAEVPGFLFDGKIKGESMIKNTGNVYSKAKYTLQVFPLFSNEEIYTNEENPESRIILPDRTLYNAVSWDETPSIGIFNVIYTSEFEGASTQVSKMVIKCPIWLLFIIIFAIVAIIIWLMAKSKSRKKARR